MEIGGNGDKEAGAQHQGREPRPLYFSPPGGIRNTSSPIEAPINTQCPNKDFSMSIFIFPLINHIVLNILFSRSSRHMNSG